VVHRDVGCVNDGKTIRHVLRWGIEEMFSDFKSSKVFWASDWMIANSSVSIGWTPDPHHGARTAIGRLDRRVGGGERGLAY
jgi:hypothetical protein